MDEPILLPFVKVYDDRIVNFLTSTRCRHMTVDELEKLDINRKKTYNGELSKRAVSHIREVFQCWSYLLRLYNELPIYKRGGYYKKFTFITLTISQKTTMTDKQVKKRCLELFFKRLEYQFDVVDYFWRAEKQKNGNIHFHIVVDRWIHKDHIRKIWNEIQRGNGLLEDYFKVHGHYNAPSTFIEGVENDVKAVDYLVKYTCKGANSLKVGGRLYSFSSRLLHLRLPSYMLDFQTSDYIEKLKANGGFKLFCSDYFSVLYCPNKKNILDEQNEVGFYYRRVFSELRDLFYIKKVDSSIIDDYLSNMNYGLSNMVAVEPSVAAKTCTDRQLSIEFWRGGVLYDS